MPYKKPLLIAGGATIVLIGAALTGDRYLIGDGVHQETNDAYVTADFTTVAPKVAGRIDAVAVEDNVKVRKGDILAHIEDNDYRAMLDVARGAVVAAQGDVANLQAALNRQDSVIAEARAAVQADEAALVFAQQNANRYRALSAGGAGTLEQGQGADAGLREASAHKARDEAAVQSAIRQIDVLKAQLERAQGVLARARGEERQAELNLSYCNIPAPVDGVVGERGVRVGAYVQAGSALLAVVPTQSAYVLANFQETQLTHVQVGQKATVWVDSFPGQPLHAHVDSLAPATGVAFAPIQPDNATGNFTKVVQRLPVKIVFDPGQPLITRMRVGMSVEVQIDTAATPDGPHAADARYAWN